MGETDWKVVPRSKRCCILFSTFLLAGSEVVVVFMDPICFRPFQLTNKICARFEDGGLEGNVTNIILPMGVMAHVVMITGIVFHWIFVRWAAKATEEEVKGANI